MLLLLLLLFAFYRLIGYKQFPEYFFNFVKILYNYSPEDRVKAFECIQMSLLLRVRGFYLSDKQEKNYHKIAWIAEIAASKIVADRKGNAFIVEKIVKIVMLFAIIIVI